MTAPQLLKNLARLDRQRIPLYLSSDKVERWYLQKVSQVIELTTSEALSGKAGSNFFGLATLEAGGEKTTEAKVAIDNVIVQCVVAENAARATKSLVDLASAPPTAGELLYYWGSARIAVMKAGLLPATTGLTESECATVTSIRRSQESLLEQLDPGAGTIVLTFKSQTRAYASIASKRSVLADPLVSYHSQQAFGILGTLESTHGGVVFIDPLWIWYTPE
jgi:hypothetical protein